MATFTYSVTDTGGVDLSLFFPGLIGAQWNGSSSSGMTSFRGFSNGAVDTSQTYTINMTGTGIAIVNGDSGISGLMTSGVLSLTQPGPTKQLATLNITLGSNTGMIGGIFIPSTMDMTPDSVTRQAARIDTDGAHLILNGNFGNDTLPGSDGNDILNGGGGSDRMEGKEGNDVYFVDSALDRVIEQDGGGTDVVNTTVSYRLADASSVEQLLAGPSAGAIDLFGNGIANTLTGNDAANRLDGGGGADTLSGLLGDDTYLVDDALDVIIEAAGQGSDSVETTVTYALAAAASIEFLRAALPSAVTNLNLTGNAFDNTIFGNAGKNNLSGDLGSDKLYGNLGNDALTGGGGKDIFAFTTKLNKSTNVDRVTDYSVADDTVWLENAIFKALGSSGSATNPAKLKAAAFFSGKSAHDANDRIIYDKASGALYYDSDGTGGSAQVKFAQLPKKLKMSASDFFVV